MRWHLFPNNWSNYRFVFFMLSSITRLVLCSGCVQVWMVSSNNLLFFNTCNFFSPWDLLGKFINYTIQVLEMTRIDVGNLLEQIITEDIGIGELSLLSL